MLKQISIQNLAILDDITLEFDDHFNVLTGETGAGKSIIIDALSLVFGQRANLEMIRHGKEMAKIEALLYLNENHAEMIYDLFELDVKDECIIQRCIYNNGRSTAKINGSLISLSTLNQIAELLIDIHSQHESQYLLKADQHLPLLHQYILSFEKNYMDTYMKNFEEYSKLIVERKFLESRFKEASDVDYLQFQLNELKDVLTLQEEEEVTKEYKYLQNFEKNAAIIEDTLYYLDGNQRANESLYSALKSLNKIQENEKITAYQQRLESAYLEIKDIIESIQSEFNTSHFDSNRLDYLSDQITKMNRLKRKYNCHDLAKLKKEIMSKIEDSQMFQQKMEDLTLRIDKQKQKCEQLAQEITKIRKKYAQKLENEIKQQLNDLYLENASFKVHFETSEQLTKLGADKIEFYMSANKGEPEKPLVKVASGGEVSRIMLGLKTVFCKVANLDTIIFDEIDTGVSGKVAMAMGKKMKDISLFAQVLAVTHLPQVASCGDNHIYIYKEIVNEKTQTRVEHLNKDRQIMEIARLLSGEKITQNSINMAKDLLFTKQ